MRRRLRRTLLITGSTLAAGAGLGLPPATAATASAAALPPGTVAVSFPGTSLLGTFVDQANGTAYVQTADNVLHAIDIATGTITASIPLATGLAGAATDPATGTIYLGSQRANIITVIDPATSTVSKTITLTGLGGTDSLAFDPGTGLLYAGLANNGVAVINPAAGTVITTINVARYPDFIALDARNGLLYTSQQAGNQVTVISTATGTVTRTFPVSEAGTSNPTLLLSPDGATLYVINGQSVAPYNAATGQPLAFTFFPSTLDNNSAALDPATGTLYRSTSLLPGGDSAIEQVSATSDKLTGTIPVSRPGTVALDQATATLVFSTGGILGGAYSDAQVLLIPLTTAGPITSPGTATFTAGKAGTLHITATGTPAPTYTEAGKLPAGLTLTSTGTLSGTPRAGTGGTYHITITATNGRGPAVTQQLTLTNHQPPAITTANHATFTHGHKATFTVRTTGYPTATLKEHGTLPSGVRFTTARNGTATIAGTPASTAKGKTYTLTLTATNGVSTTTQHFTLKIS